MKRAEDGTLRATHAQLAAELGTAREVISRQLAEFQRRGWVELGAARSRFWTPPRCSASPRAERGVFSWRKTGKRAFSSKTKELRFSPEKRPDARLV
jgi:DNA-binding IclR family transcriptional regulator